MSSVAWMDGIQTRSEDERERDREEFLESLRQLASSVGHESNEDAPGKRVGPSVVLK